MVILYKPGNSIGCSCSSVSLPITAACALKLKESNEAHIKEFSFKLAHSLLAVLSNIQ